MNYTLTNPLGYEYHLQLLQTDLYGRLCSRWGVNDSNYNAFGKVQRIKKDEGYIPMYFDPVKNTYVTGTGSGVMGGMFFEDKKAITSYFGVEDPVKDNYGTSTLKCRLFYFIDLNKITPGGLPKDQQGGQRLDELAINDVKQMIQNKGYGFTILDDHRNIDKVLEWYGGALKKRALLDDMGNKLCFCIELQLLYNRNLVTENPVIPMPQDHNRSLVMFIKTSPDPTKKIAVGNGKYIQQEYAPGDTLTPKLIGDANSYLAGKVVDYPFYYNNSVDTVPSYNETTGIWDRATFAISPSYGFNDGDFALINFKDFK